MYNLLRMDVNFSTMKGYQFLLSSSFDKDTVSTELQQKVAF